MDEDRKKYARIRIPAIQYARDCWPMCMQEHGYSRDEVVTYRHFALEDYWAGYSAGLEDGFQEGFVKGNDR